jgi:predicted amidohydrolase
MKADHLLVTLVQKDIAWEDKAENLRQYSLMLAELKGKTDLVLMPEMFSTGFSMDPGQLAEGMDGDTVRWMKKMAAETTCCLAGSLIVREEGKFYNRAVWCDPDGSLSWYDKRHLFRMAGEETAFTAGISRTVVNLKGWNVCLQVCYDLRFPVWSRNRGDYDLLVYLSNWPAARSDVWNTLLRARAIENQCYVAGVNRTGTDGNKIVYQGESMVIDAKGQPVCKTASAQESTTTVSLSLPELNEFRMKFPVWKDRDDFRVMSLPAGRQVMSDE